MQRFWHKISPYWHIITSVIFAIFLLGTYWNRVDGYDDRIGSLEVVQTTQQKTLDRMDYNIQNIANKVGVRPLKKPE